MIFTETRIKGVWVVEPERREDERGFFARTFCEKEFAERGLCTHWAQCSIAFSRKKGTLRGMHWQAAPHEEIKLVRCTRGAIHDVALDLRPDSPTFRQWVAVELTAENRKMLYISGGIAHGLLTLEDNAEVFYQITEFYHPECQRGVRWDDPAFGIIWPEGAKILSDRDGAFPPVGDLVR